MRKGNPLARTIRHNTVAVQMENSNGTRYIRRKRLPASCTIPRDWIALWCKQGIIPVIKKVMAEDKLTLSKALCYVNYLWPRTDRDWHY